MSGDRIGAAAALGAGNGGRIKVVVYPFILVLILSLALSFPSEARHSVSEAGLAAAASPVRSDKKTEDKKPDNKNTQPSEHKPTQLYIASGTMVSGSGAPIQLHDFHALIVDGDNEKSGKQDKNSGNKVVTVNSGSAFLSNASLGRLLNSKLAGSQLEDIKVTTAQNKVKISGKAKKKLDMPFSVEGPVTLTEQGFIRLQTDSTKVAHLPGLAGLLGVDPEKIAGSGKVKGITTEKDAITFDPDLLWGLPVHGRVTRVALEKNGLLLVFGGKQQRKPKAHQAAARSQTSVANSF